MPDNQVRPERAPSKASVSDALAVCWSRAARKVGKGRFADTMECDPKTVNRALTGETVPELHTALASLLADPCALDEVFALYGFDSPRKRHCQAANDMATVSGLSSVVTAFCEALKDGHRNHKETLELADLVRTVMPSLVALMEDASRIRGVAA